MFKIESGAMRLAGLLGVILFIVLFNGWFLYYNFQKVNDQESWVRHTNVILGELELVLSSAKDAETGARGFLWMKEAEYLEPFRDGASNGIEHIERLKKLTSDSPIQQTNIAALEKLFVSRVEILKDLINAVEKSSIAEIKDLVGDGKTVMDQLRSKADEMIDHENALLVQRKEIVRNGTQTFFWVLILTTLLNVAVIVLAFRLFRANQDRLAREATAKERERWINENAAEAAGLVAGDRIAEDVAYEIQKFLARRLGVLASNFFVFDGGRSTLLSSYGLDEKVSAAAVNRSLVDEAFDRDQVWSVEKIPAEYWRISSSLGSAIPKGLVFLPLHFQGSTVGLVEMGFFEKPTDAELEVLKRIGDSVGAGLNAAISRQHLQELLEKTQMQAEELETQQEELKANNEELEQQARAMESQQQALNIKNNELESARLDLEAKTIDLERSSKYKSEFLAKMSHELRTPLNGLLILSTLLTEDKEKRLSEQQKQFAQSINTAGNDLLVLINDILDLSKIEARKLTMKPEDFTVATLLKHMENSFAVQATNKGLDFKTVVTDEVKNLRLFTDRQRLEQILRNFLSNALKFTEQGSVTLEAKNAGTGRIEVIVRDTGIGIPKTKQAMVFEAFEQADSSTSRKYGGTGLGLTISRELASLLGGEIRLQSDEGRGSVFSIVFPMELKTTEDGTASVSEPWSAAPRPPEATPANKVAARKSAPAVSAIADKIIREIPPGQRTILVVEDDADFRKAVINAVNSYDFYPIAADDGEVALAILEKHTPTAILLDIKLPGISGLGILEMIKQMPQLRHIPVHMISALDYQHNALRMGALGYLTKPVTVEKIRSAVERIENLISRDMKHILIVEDDEVQSTAVSNLVSGKDVVVTSVRTGKDAIGNLKENSFDCVILDLSLPDMSGFDLLAEMNALDISLPPIVIYTGKDLSPDEEGYLRRFSESIIIKGARSPERLLDEVNLFLHRVESLLPQDKREMLSHLRSQDQNFSGKTVLLVDDDMRNVFALTSALESKDLQVRIAKDGVEALEALERYKDIDVVLMDIMMPRMDGFEAMKRIRQSSDERVSRLPIIALTAKAMREDHEKCMEAGASDYLPKPINLNNLMTSLKVWLSPKGIFS